MNQKKYHTEVFKKVQNAYEELNKEPPAYEERFFNSHDNIFNFSCFDNIFEEMEKKIELMSLPKTSNGSFYSKQQYTCTRNGKTITKIEENINGEIKQYESYDSRPINRRNLLNMNSFL
jgi:hypothetical protein